MIDSFRLLPNPSFAAGAPYADEQRTVVSLSALQSAWAEARQWPDYAPTPLHSLEDASDSLNVGAVLLKDEGARLGLGSFKAIGGAYGVLRAIQDELRVRHGIEADSEALRAGSFAEAVDGIELTCATDGNHGRAVAWAAGVFGCRCVVYVPRIVSPARRRAIEELGAVVIGVDGTYDGALAVCRREAAAAARLVVSDQSYEGYEEIPRNIMQGYSIVAAEVADELSKDERLSHVFVQGGVGGLAAGIGGYFWERFGNEAPRVVCVEPHAADCLYRSALAGRLVQVPGDLDTVMGCLSCGEASMLAWRILATGVAAFVTIDDATAVDAMCWFAGRSGHRASFAVGESGAAGFAGFGAVAADERARDLLRLDQNSRVLVIASEGANDPETYARLTGRSPAQVAESGGATRG